MNPRNVVFYGGELCTRSDAHDLGASSSFWILCGRTAKGTFCGTSNHHNKSHSDILKYELFGFGSEIKNS